MLLEECLQATVKAAMTQDGVIHAHNLGALATAAELAAITEHGSGAPNKEVQRTDAARVLAWWAGTTGLRQAALCRATGMREQIHIATGTDLAYSVITQCVMAPTVTGWKLLLLQCQY
jgi:hypothetical protein